MSNRDLKHTSRAGGRSAPAGKSSGGLMTGVLVGLIVGVGIAVGMTMYLNRASTPFSNLEKMQGKEEASLPAAELLEPGAKLATTAAPVPVPAPVAVPAVVPASAPVAAVPAKPAPADADGQRFDFYKILPGQQEAIQQDGKPADAAQPPALPRLFLQAGAFQSESDADNMKAKLALMGVEAKIQSLNLPEKGLVHRVRIGPFERQEDVDALKARLRQEGVDASLVKLPAK
ncbi:MAG: SPOR domain-containing protein [Vogesella sp.]|nr:SPOR domain-containing protein [Vogesella sp.]